MATFRYSEIKKTKEEETIRNAQNGCRESMTLLCQEYEPLIAATAARFSSYHRGVEYDDAYQQSSLYFIECVRNYSTKEATTHKGLRYWAAKCVPPRMIDFWKTRTTIHAPHAHCPGTDAEKVTAARNSRNFSVIESRSSGRGESINSYPFMADRKQKAPEDIAEDNDYIDAVSDVVSSFSDRDSSVFRDYCNGMSHVEIGEKNGFSKQRSDQIVKSIVDVAKKLDSDPDYVAIFQNKASRKSTRNFALP